MSGGRTGGDTSHAVPDLCVAGADLCRPVRRHCRLPPRVHRQPRALHRLVHHLPLRHCHVDALAQVHRAVVGVARRRCRQLRPLYLQGRLWPQPPLCRIYRHGHLRLLHLAQADECRQPNIMFTGVEVLVRTYSFS